MDLRIEAELYRREHPVLLSEAECAGRAADAIWGAEYVEDAMFVGSTRGAL